ncbi:MAG TPA: serine hydrolase [Dehalococcoidales bacterium]|nr:serine hydrolase [Dehalococcoidales bacterium]
MERMSSFDDFVNEKLSESGVPGVAIAIAKNGKVVLSKGYGKRNIAQDLPVTQDTVFAIGSSTKSFTSTAIGILADKGKINFDAPVKTYIPWFKMYNPSAAELVTARDLLCHRTGLPRHDHILTDAKLSRKELVQRIEYLQPNAGFRYKWQYSNLMFIAAGYLVETVSGRTWEEYVRENIFAPLGMKSSGFSINDLQKSSDFSKPYARVGSDVFELPYGSIETIGPAGSIHSNIKDMTSWIMLQLNKGVFSGHRIISETNINQLQTTHMPCGEASEWNCRENRHSSYGLGWYVDSFRAHKLIHHGGNIDGFSSFVSFMPEDNLGVVVLSNLNVTYLPIALSYEIYDRLLGFEGIDWTKIIESNITNALESLKAAAIKSSLPPRKEGTHPSHILKEYTGKFVNPGYGIVHISLENDALKLQYGMFDTTIAHYHYDTFGFEAMLLFATFRTDKFGNVDSVSIRLEMDPAIDDILFSRIE